MKTAILKRSGAAEAHRAHNPGVGGSKPLFAYFILQQFFFAIKKPPDKRTSDTLTQFGRVLPNKGGCHGFKSHM